MGKIRFLFLLLLMSFSLGIFAEGGEETAEEWGLLLVVLISVLGILGAVLACVALVFTFCYVFKYRSLATWFNKKCEQEVIPYKRFNKLLLPPVAAALATLIATWGLGAIIGLAEPESASQTGLLLLGGLLLLATPFCILCYVYFKYKRLYGKKAARWVMVYSLLSVVAIYLVCVALAYAVVGIAAILVLALIFSLAFPTRYYIVRRW